MTAVQWREVRVGDRFTERGETFEVDAVGCSDGVVRVSAHVIRAYFARRPAGDTVQVQRPPNPRG